MKMYYFSQVKPEDKGVYKKKIFQEKALLKNGVDLRITNCKIISNKKYMYYFENFELGKESYLNKIDFFKRRLFQKNRIYLKILKMCKKEDVTHIYIRYYRSDYFFLKFLEFLKKSKIKIILEIPTYPYDDEVEKKNISLLIDKYYRVKLYKFVDKVVTYSEDLKIWGIPCINISNGIDLNEIKLINKKIRNKDKIIFSSVSNCSFWHGIDRFLNSLEKYGHLKCKKEIVFNIVGEGTELEKLKEIVSKSKYLCGIVKFQGFKIDKELDEIYNETDIAIGCLGNHRKGLYTVQALKNKEYMAKGLPMIFSEDDPGLRGKKFVFKASHDEKLIDIEELISWYEALKITSKEIRKYSEDFTWDKQMKKVIENI